MKRFSLPGCSLAMAVIAAPALAHHSFAMFDQTKQQSVQGTVTEFQWTNPHAFIHVKSGDDVYEVELNSPNNLKRQGWRSDILKPGDRITIVLNPLRDTAKKGGLFVSATLPDGKVLGDQTRAGGGPVNVPVVP